MFKAHQSYLLLYLGGGTARARLALPADFIEGSTSLPNGKTFPVALSDVARLQGYRWFFRGPAVKLADVPMYRWFHAAIYENKSILRVFALSLIEGASFAWH